VNTSGNYAHKHNPWANWQAASPTGNQLPSSTNQPFTSFPTDYSTLPTVAFVVPDLQNDMHDGTIAAGDTWCKNNVDGYAQWAKAHNSLLILTFDEDDSSQSNQIATIFSGPMVKTGQYSETINHYSLLGMVEDMYGLSRIGGAVGKAAITDTFLVPEPGMMVWMVVGIGVMKRRRRR
jgi:acid phosphatase